MKAKCYKENSIIIQRLEKRIKEDKLAHAYLFEGSADVDKYDFAINFVKTILCPKFLGENCGDCSICDKLEHDNCEDLIYIEKKSKNQSKVKSVKDDDIMEMQVKLSFAPVGKRHIVVINDCETMTLKAQNRLLKTLEEPSEGSILILLVDNRENLIQTILSRCVKYKLEGQANEVQDEKAAKLVKRILNKEPFYLIKNDLAAYSKDQEKAELFLTCMEHEILSLIKQGEDGVSLNKFDNLYDFIHAIEDARLQIMRGMSSAYALKHLVLAMNI